MMKIMKNNMRIRTPYSLLWIKISNRKTFCHKCKGKFSQMSKISTSTVCLTSGKGLGFWCFEKPVHPILSENCSDQKRHMKWDRKNKKEESIHKKKKEKMSQLSHVCSILMFFLNSKKKRKTRRIHNTKKRNKIKKNMQLQKGLWLNSA